MQVVCLARALAFTITGNVIAARITMIAMTIRSSVNEKARTLISEGRGAR